MKISIRWKYLSLILIITLLLLAYLTFVWLPQSYDNARSDYEEIYAEHVETIGESLLPYLIQNQIAAVHETLDFFIDRDPKWVAISLYDKTGAQLYPIMPFEVLEDENFLTVEKTLNFRGAKFSKIIAQVDISGHIKAIDENQMRLFISLLTALLIAALLTVLYFEFFITRPVKKLTKASQNIAQGKLVVDAFRKQNDEIGQLAAAFSDMSKELLLQRENAKAAQEAKSNFLSTMSHEIRTPLNGVVAISQLLQETDLNDSQREMVDTVVVSADLLMTVINDVLDFSKIEIGRLELEKRPFKPAEVERSVFQLMEQVAAKKGIKLVSSFIGDCGTILEGDTHRLSQVLLNLTNNAIKFTSEGSVSVTFELIEKGEREIELNCEVVDTGIGIEKDKIDNLFQRFEQVDNSISRQFGGTGLGLAISKSLVEAMGGGISVKSKLGEGSCFSFSIPMRCLEKEEAISSVCAPAQIIERVGNARILVAEDNAINQKVVMKILKNSGHQVLVVENGIEAVKICQEEAFDLVLMDMQMPEMDGLEATRQIRNETGPNQKAVIVALTANATVEAIERAKGVGMDAYIAKPFKPKELLDTVNQLFAGRKNVMPLLKEKETSL